jgi:hypothetical protein
VRPLVVTATVLVVLSTVVAGAEAQRRRREPALGLLTIQSSQSDAEVLVDEEVVGVTPLDPIRVSAGSHTVRVRRPGFTEFSEVVEVRPGQNVQLSVDLLALSMVLTVRTQPDQARVFVDGAYRGTSPIEVELIEGEHSVRITHPTHREVIRTVTAIPGRTDVLSVELEALPAGETGPRSIEWFEEPLVWIGVGSGIAVIAVAVALGIVLGQGGSQLASFCSAESDCIIVEPLDWRW